MNIGSHIYSFQYRLITCYVLLLISLTVFAQSGKERFSGRVIETETNQPVPFATVRLLAYRIVPYWRVGQQMHKANFS